MHILLMLAVFLFYFPSFAYSATFYLSNNPATVSSCGASSVTYNDVTGLCGSGSLTVYTTMAGVCSAHASGDTIIVRGGTTYTETWANNCIKSGVGPGFTLSTIIGAYPGESPVIKPSASGTSACAIYIENKHSIIIDGIEIYGIQCTAGGAGVYIQNLTGMPSYIRISNSHIHDTHNKSGILIACDFCEILNNEIDHNGNLEDPAPPNQHGVYYKVGQSPIVRGNNIHHNANYGVQFYTSPISELVEYNWVHENGVLQKSAEVGTHGNGGTYRYNAIGCSDPAVAEAGIQVRYGDDPKQNVDMHNNSILNCRTGIDLSAGTGMKIKNHVILGATTAIFDGATATSFTTNITSGTPSSYFVNPSTFDLRLKSTSPALDACTDLGEGFAGSARDCGAFEMAVLSSASINTNQIDLTFQVVNGPMIAASGTTGWVVNCTGASSCPSTPLPANVNAVSGVSNKLRITVSGITANACQVGEVWTISFSSTTGTVTDAISVGAQLNQPINTISSFSVTNACSGGGGTTPPSSPKVFYKFDGNALDFSGNSLNGTVVGSITWSSSGFVNQGLQTHAAVQEYVTAAYGSGINPYSQSLSVCVSVYITPGTKSTASLVAYGTSVDINRRFYAALQGGSWGMGIQGSNSGGTSDLAAVDGWNRVCMVANSGTHTVKLYLNGVAGTTGDAVATITSFTLASNFDIGHLPGNNSANAIYDEFKIWDSAIDPAVDFASYGGSGGASGQFSQATHRFEAVYLDSGVVVLGSNGASQDVVESGAVAIQFQINCDNVADCAATQFKPYLSLDCATFTEAVPDSATASGVYFWGNSSLSTLNSGTTSGALTGALSHTNGGTILSSSALTTYDLAQNTSLTMRIIVKLSYGIAPRTICIRMQEQNGAVFTGTYTPSTGAQINVKNFSHTLF